MNTRLGVLCVALTLVAAACGQGGGSEASEGGSADDGEAAAVEVTAEDFAFDPTEIELESGRDAELTFTNNDDATHSFTADDLDVEVVADGGQTKTTTFTAPDSGTVEWHCKFHSDMTGEISIGGGGAGSSGPKDKDKDKDDGGGRY